MIQKVSQLAASLKLLQVLGILRCHVTCELCSVVAKTTLAIRRLLCLNTNLVTVVHEHGLLGQRGAGLRQPLQVVAHLVAAHQDAGQLPVGGQRGLGRRPSHGRPGLRGRGGGGGAGAGGGLLLGALPRHGLGEAAQHLLGVLIPKVR